LFTSDLAYAQIHNEGGTVSAKASVKTHSRTSRTGKSHKVKAHNRNVNFKMPQRQFMGESKELERQIVQMIDEKLSNFFGKKQ
jgi:phage gpG-like protein